MRKDTEPLKIALLSIRDARDVRSWSGTPYFSKAALERHLGRVVDLSPAPVRILLFRIVRKLVKILTGRTYSYDHDPLLARLYGRYFTRLVERERPDLIYAPAGSACLAFVRTDVPVVYYSDATWRLVHGYQPSFSNVTRRSARGGEELEQRTLDRADVALFASHWASSSAVADYGAPPDRVHTVYIGANLVNPPARDEVLPRRLGDRVRLLFIGTIWELKGGPIAVATLERLLELGFDAELTVVGSRPPGGIDHPRVRVIHFLNKQIPEEREEFEQLWRNSDFFILPTRCEAAGIVFCEASAHAIPSLATDTGGVGSLVVNGENGYTLPMEASGIEWAQKIVELLENPDRYAALCEASRDTFERRLNWDAWGRSVAKIVSGAFPEYSDRIGEWQSLNSMRSVREPSVVGRTGIA